MPFNPKSLENLTGSEHKKGQRQRLTRAFVSTLTDYLVNDLPTFLAELESLTPKDRVAAKLKMMEMILPKDLTLQVESEDEVTKPSWVINFTSTPVEEAVAPILLEEVKAEEIVSSHIKSLDDEIKLNLINEY